MILQQKKIRTKMIQPSDSSSREKILSAVRNIQQRTVVVSDNYRPEDVFFQPDDLLAVFKDEVEAVAGQCNVFSSDVELYASIAGLVSERNWECLVTADTTIAANLNNSVLQYDHRKTMCVLCLLRLLPAKPW